MTEVDTTGIAEPHRSAAVAIRHAASQGWFTMAYAEVLVDRLRGLGSPPVDDGDPVLNA